MLDFREGDFDGVTLWVVGEVINEGDVVDFTVISNSMRVMNSEVVHEQGYLLVVKLLAKNHQVLDEFVCIYR